MKKSIKKLALSRETIQHLENQRMVRLGGASEITRCVGSCDLIDTTCVNEESTRFVCSERAAC